MAEQGSVGPDRPGPGTPELWAWSQDPDDESVQGPFSTREEAVEYGLSESDADEHGGYLWHARHIRAEVYISADVDLVIESAEERLYEDACFDDTTFEVSDRKAAQEALDELLTQWARDHVAAGGRFLTYGEPERIERPRP